MKTLATYTNNYDVEFELIKTESDFFAYGTKKEFNSLFGPPVNQCGTYSDVLNHCLSVVNLCNQNITKYKKFIIFWRPLGLAWFNSRALIYYISKMWYNFINLF